MDITKIKNAESLSTKKPKFKNDEPERENENGSPKITDIEKMIPKTDAIAALKKEQYVTNLSFLLKVIDRIPPTRKKMISPENRLLLIIETSKKYRFYRPSILFADTVDVRILNPSFYIIL